MFQSRHALNLSHAILYAWHAQQCCICQLRQFNSERIQTHTSSCHVVALLVLTPRRSCPFCEDSALLHDDLPGGHVCCFPASAPGGNRPQHTYSYEFDDHFLKHHDYTLPALEGLYRAIWNQYMMKTPDVACPVKGLELPPSKLATPRVEPGKVGQVVQHLQLAVGLLEALHW